MMLVWKILAAVSYKANIEALSCRTSRVASAPGGGGVVPIRPVR